MIHSNGLLIIICIGVLCDSHPVGDAFALGPSVHHPPASKGSVFNTDPRMERRERSDEIDGPREPDRGSSRNRDPGPKPSNDAIPNPCFASRPPSWCAQ